jgi:hypothetical protein
MSVSPKDGVVDSIEDVFEVVVLAGFDVDLCYVDEKVGGVKVLATT